MEETRRGSTIPFQFPKLFLPIPKEEVISRARLLNLTTRIISLIAILFVIVGFGLGILDVSSADGLASILVLFALTITAFLTFVSQSRSRYQAATLIFIFGFTLSVSIAVWQFGSRVPEVHLGYLIPVALAATLWGSVPGSITAVIVWAANVLVVANQPGSTPIHYSIRQSLGLLGMAAAYFAVAVVVGRYAENLVDALGRAEQKAREAAEAEKQARRYAEDLASSLRAERARRLELGTLYSLASRLTATSKLEDFLPFTTESIVSSLQVTTAIVALIDKAKGSDAVPSLVLAACHPGRTADCQVGIGHKVPLVSLPAIADVIERRQCRTVRLDHNLCLKEIEAEFLSTSTLTGLAICPILIENVPLGALILGEARAWEIEPLSEEKLQLARSIADLTAGAIQRSGLFAELEDAYVQTVLALAKAVEAKDTYTADHAERLADQAARVARKLGVNDPGELQALRFGAMLHDVGKIGVPDSVLKKPGPLDPDEWRSMQQHPVIGGRILETVARLRGASKIVRHHHERWDGKGYPDGIAGEAIPLGARILTVVDSYSAIVDARIYKAARSQAEAIAELQRGKGTQFDPRVVEAFLEISVEQEKLSSGFVPHQTSVSSDLFAEKLASDATLTEGEELN